MKIRYIRPKNGEKEFIAVLTGYDGENIEIERNGAAEKISLSETAFVKLHDDADWEKEISE